MKESLAARQAALLRQNAELDQKVEAIEQRRQQQLLKAKSASSGSSLKLTKRNETSPAEPSTVLSDGEHGAVHDDDDASDAQSSSPDHAKSPASRLSFAVDLSASIDSSTAPEEPEKSEAQRADAKSPTTSGGRKSQLMRDKSMSNVVGAATVAGPASPSDSARKPLRRYKTGLPIERPRGVQNVNAFGAEPRPQDAKSDATQNAADVGEEDGLGLDATVRYQKARLRVLQDELDTAHSEVKHLQGNQQKLQATTDELAGENAALAKKHQHAQLLLEKQQELSAAQESKQKILETQLSAAQTKIEELQRAEKQASQQFRSKDVRLNRALEELEKLKAQLQEERRAQGDQTVPKAEYEQLAKENKRLEKQKSELLVAFKKQMKLIDLLKRQRIHMEAAKMLSFTEEEFSKTLELG